MAPITIDWNDPETLRLPITLPDGGVIANMFDLTQCPTSRMPWATVCQGCGVAVPPSTNGQPAAEREQPRGWPFRVCAQCVLHAEGDRLARVKDILACLDKALPILTEAQVHRLADDHRNLLSTTFINPDLRSWNLGKPTRWEHVKVEDFLVLVTEAEAMIAVTKPRHSPLGCGLCGRGTALWSTARGYSETTVVGKGKSYPLCPDCAPCAAYEGRHDDPANAMPKIVRQRCAAVRAGRPSNTGAHEDLPDPSTFDRSDGGFLVLWCDVADREVPADAQPWWHLDLMAENHRKALRDAELARRAARDAELGITRPHLVPADLANGAAAAANKAMGRR